MAIISYIGKLGLGMSLCVAISAHAEYKPYKIKPPAKTVTDKQEIAKHNAAEEEKRIETDRQFVKDDNKRIRKERRAAAGKIGVQNPGAPRYPAKKKHKFKKYHSNKARK